MNAVLAPSSCYHCGLPAQAGNGLDVVIGGAARAMCCPGCAAVAQAIVDNGLADYYRNRSQFAAPADAVPLVPAQLAELDKAAVVPEGDGLDAVFSVDGIRCAACAWLIERQLARLPGVVDSAMNLSSSRLRVRFDGAQVKVSDVVRSLRAIGYTAYPFDAARHDAALERERKGLFRKLFIAGLSMMQVMMYALPAYVADDGTMDADMAALMRWASLLLTAPAVLYSALPFYRGAWRGLLARMPGMDLPVAIGIVAASVASVIATVRGVGEVYFDSVTMFVFLLLASRYLELVARRRASRGLEQLRHALPASCTRIVGGCGEIVAVAALCAGDLIGVAPGEAIAADGVVVEGGSEIDLALLTGEARAQPCAVGDEVPGGAVNVAQPLVLRVSRPAGESTLSQLVRLAERAGEGKPHIGTWADKVAAWFVVVLLLLTVAVFGAWQLIEPARAWQVAIAVLVVSCPCALSLATPSALAAATSLLVKRGVLVVQPHVLETLQRATHVVFDKTGTLTQGKPVLVRVQPLAWLERQRVLAVAAALEAGSAHPLAMAIRSACECEPPAAQDVASEAGQGVSGLVDGVRYRLGRASWACARHVAAGDDVDYTSVYLGDGERAFARFDLADALRPEAAQVVRRLQAAGKQVLILSGDADSVARKVADELGIRTAIGRQLPRQKLECVRRLQEGGAVVAMVGDGINDAAVLRAADVSFAMGGGSALAQLGADCVLVSGRLQSLADCARVAGRTLAVIRQNLGWATVYNALAIPAAACGLINPWVSAVGMSASSALVVLNALRLMRAKGE
jgi:Cu2+-exporting ATPase